MAHNSGFLKLVEAARSRIKETNVDAVYARMQKGEKLNIIDVREDNEWAAGRVKGAKHLGKGIIERDIEESEPDLSKELILYCGGGYRSALAADALRQMGYTNVISMDGGIKGWRAKGLPEDRG